MRGRTHIGVVMTCLFLAVPAMANGWTGFKIQDPLTHWDVVSFPASPAPLERLAAKPLWFHDLDRAPWSFPTEAHFVAYAAPTTRSLWVVVALERYQTRLLSPVDYPYIVANARIPLVSSPITPKF